MSDGSISDKGLAPAARRYLPILAVSCADHVHAGSDTSTGAEQNNKHHQLSAKVVISGTSLMPREP